MTKTQIRQMIGVITLCGFFGMVATLIFVPIPGENGDILKILVGFMGGMALSVVGHYFGSSEG